jgi:hypothetical protein
VVFKGGLFQTKLKKKYLNIQFSFFCKYLVTLYPKEKPFSFAIDKQFFSPPKAVFTCLLKDAYLVAGIFAHKHVRALIRKKHKGTRLPFFLKLLGYDVCYFTGDCELDRGLYYQMKEKPEFILYFQDKEEKAEDELITLSKKTSLPIIPTTLKAKKSFLLKDYLLAFPFSSISICYGEPIIVPSFLNDDLLMKVKEKLREGLNMMADDSQGYNRGSFSS